MITGSSLTANVCVGQVVLAVVADVAAEGDFVHYWAQSNAGSLLVDALLHPSVRSSLPPSSPPSLCHPFLCDPRLCDPRLSKPSRLRCHAIPKRACARALAHKDTLTH